MLIQTRPAPQVTSLGHSPNGWVDESAIAEAVDSLHCQLEDIDASPAAAPTDWTAKAANVQRWTTIAVIGAAVLISIPFGLNLLRNMNKPDFQLTGATLGRAACGLMLVGGFVYFIWGRRRDLKLQRIGLRDMALREFASRAESVRCGDFAKITGESVGSLPWLATELDYVVECDLYGSYRGHRLALLRCTYVIDTSLTSLEGSVGKLAADVMSHVQHERVRRQQLEAVVFLDAAPDLPDIFAAAQKQPLIWYFKRALQSFGLQATINDSHWLASSDANCCRRFLDSDAGRLFAGRPNAMLQVLGGYIAVIPHTYDWHRPEFATDVDQVRQNLDWACKLYECLAPGTASASELDAQVPYAAIPTPASQVSPPNARAGAFSQPMRATPSQPARPGPARRTLALTFGFLFFFAGGIVSLAMLTGPLEARRAGGWPTVEGRIVKSDVDVSQGLSTMYAANVEYDFTVAGRTYHGRRLAIGPPEKDGQRANIDAVLARYPVNQAVSVHYNPANPGEVVLEPRIASAGVQMGVSVFSAAITAAGAYLLYRGFRRPRLPTMASAGL